MQLQWWEQEGSEKNDRSQEEKEKKNKTQMKNSDRDNAIYKRTINSIYILCLNVCIDDLTKLRSTSNLS